MTTKLLTALIYVTLYPVLAILCILLGLGMLGVKLWDGLTEAA